MEAARTMMQHPAVSAIMGVKILFLIRMSVDLMDGPAELCPDLRGRSPGFRITVDSVMLQAGYFRAISGR